MAKIKLEIPLRLIQPVAEVELGEVLRVKRKTERGNNSYPINVSTLTPELLDEVKSYINFKIPKYKKYVINDGHHRYAGYLLAGRETITAYVEDD